MTTAAIDYSERAQQMAPGLSARSDEIAASRELPADISSAFAEAGFYHLLVPTDLGGAEAHPGELVSMLEILSAADGSAGWCAMISSLTGLLAASLSEAHAREIYGTFGVNTCGVVAPRGRADVVDGGYRVSGRWPFASGCTNADWVCGGAIVYEGDAPREASPGQPESHLMLFPIGDVQIHDTWHVAGLEGTGSHDIEVADVFVPEGRSVRLDRPPRIDRPLYRLPLLGVLAIGLSAVALGIGRRALDEFRELAQSKRPTGSERPLAARAAAQEDAALAAAQLRAGRAYIDAAVAEAWQEAETGPVTTLEQRANLRLAAAYATRVSADAVDRLYTAAGGSSPYLASALQRCFRDIHVVTQHAMVARPIFEATGRVVLGNDPRRPL